MNLKINAMPTVRFMETCLPSPADRPPPGSGWLHEIKHDGYRLMARRDSVGVRLITRRGNDWSDRFPLVIEAVNHLRVRTCLIDGEVVCCDERGLARFDVLRRRRNEAVAFLYAFDLLELDGTDLRREPVEVRKATLIPNSARWARIALIAAVCWRMNRWRAMEHQAALLLRRLGLHKPHVCPGDCFANGLGVSGIILLALDVDGVIGRPACG